jgi:hypothetical protein
MSMADLRIGELQHAAQISLDVQALARGLLGAISVALGDGADG